MSEFTSYHYANDKELSGTYTSGATWKTLSETAKKTVYFFALVPPARSTSGSKWWWWCRCHLRGDYLLLWMSLSSRERGDVYVARGWKTCRSVSDHNINPSSSRAHTHTHRCPTKHPPARNGSRKEANFTCHGKTRLFLVKNEKIIGEGSFFFHECFISFSPFPNSTKRVFFSPPSKCCLSIFSSFPPKPWRWFIYDSRERRAICYQMKFSLFFGIAGVENLLQRFFSTRASFCCLWRPPPPATTNKANLHIFSIFLLCSRHMNKHRARSKSVAMLAFSTIW